jgi:hypothetical protein
MPKDFGVESVTVPAGRATAEELFGGEKLLMNFQSGLEPECGIVARGHFIEWFERHTS